MAFDPHRAGAKDSMHVLTTDSMHALVETGNDLLKPINENPTNANVPNPFAQARSARLQRTVEEPAQSAAASHGR